MNDVKLVVFVDRNHELQLGIHPDLTPLEVLAMLAAIQQIVLENAEPHYAR